MINNLRMALAAAMAGMILLLAPGAAEAAPVKAKSICETGGRESAEYRRKCMTRGTIADAAREWYSVPVGRKGHETRDGFNRRSVCKYAREFGGIRPATRELFFDVAYDSYLRHGHVLNWISVFAARDCRAMGYRV